MDTTTNSYYAKQQSTPPQTVSRGVGYDPSNYAAPTTVTSTQNVIRPSTSTTASRNPSTQIWTGSQTQRVTNINKDSLPNDLTEESINMQLQRSKYSTRHQISIQPQSNTSLRSTKPVFQNSTQIIMHHDDGTQSNFYQGASRQADLYSGGVNHENMYMPSNYHSYNKSQLNPIPQGQIRERTQHLKANPIAMQQAAYGFSYSESSSQQPGYFFDSPSKYVSLKQYKQQFSQTSIGSKPNSNLSGKQEQKLAHGKMSASQAMMMSDGPLNIKDWFDKLSLQEKSIVLTVVDKQLVNLVFQMYKVYQQNERNVKFFNRHPSAHFNPEHIHRVKNYNLLYKTKPKGYTYDHNTAYLRQIAEGEDVFINAIRLLNLTENADTKSQSNNNAHKQSSKSSKKAITQQANTKKHPQIEALISQDRQKIGGSSYINNFDSITLDVSFYKNTSYFFEMLKNLNGNTQIFLKNNFELSKDSKRLEHSVFYQDINGVSQTENPIPKQFYTFVPKYEDNKEISLGQCLALIFEKAINVQYQDYLSKLDTRHQHFFFLHAKDRDALHNTVFARDQILISNWAAMKLSEREYLVNELLERIEREIREEEHRPVKAALLGGTSIGQLESVFESEGDADQGSNEDEEEETDIIERARKEQKRDLNKAKQRITGIFKQDSGDENEGDPYSRTRGVASNRLKIKVGAHGQIQGDSDEDEEADIERGNTKKRYIYDDEDEELPSDIEPYMSQTLSRKSGPVGKLKDTIKNSRSTFAPKHYGGKSHIQNEDSEEDEWENYPDDFEVESEHDTYFLENEHKYTQSYSKNSYQVTTVTKEFKNQMIESLENPLMIGNKFFFVRKELNKYYRMASHEHQSHFETIEIMSFEFIKRLSTFISLQIAYVASQSLICTATNKIVTFGTSTGLPSSIMGESTETLGALVIPIKQRLYQYMLEAENRKYLELLDSLNQPDDQVPANQLAITNTPHSNVKGAKQSTANNSSMANLQKASEKLQYTAAKTQDTFKKGKEGTKTQQQEPATQSKNPTQNQNNQKEPQKTKSENESSNQQSVPGANTQANKMKKKKKKEKEKAKKLAQAQENAKLASQQQDITQLEEEKQPESSIPQKDLDQLTQEASSINIIKQILARGSTKAADQLYSDACTFKLNTSSMLDGESRFPSLLTHIDHHSQVPLDEEIRRIRYKEERTSLLSNEYLPTKYPDEKLSNAKQSDSSSMLLLDPTIIPDRKTTIQQILYGSTTPDQQQQSDVEMVDVEGMESKYQADEEAKQGGGNKKKKRNKKKKNKKKEKNANANQNEEDSKLEKQSEPIEIEMIELKPKRQNLLEVKKREKDPDSTVTEIEDNVDDDMLSTQHMPKTSHSQHGGNISPIDKISIETPSDVRQDIERVRKLEAEIGEVILIAEREQRSLQECATSLINTTIESIQREEEEEYFANLNKQEHQPLEEQKLEEVQLPPQIEVTEVIDLKKTNQQVPEITMPTIVHSAPPQQQMGKNNKKGQNNKKGKKGGDQQQLQNQNNANQPQKLNKKQQKQARNAAKRAQMAEKNTSEEAKQQILQEIEKYQKTILEQHPLPKVDALTQELINGVPLEDKQVGFLSNENLQILDRQNREQQDRQSNATPEKSERSKKSVGFRVTATTPRQPSFFQTKNPTGYHSSGQEEIDEQVKIPKRGSSRGSSCTEEAIHQSTINMLGDLFPQQYKNPSDDTKLRISKITTSSSGASNKGGESITTSPAGEIPQSASGKPLTNSGKVVTSKFLEEPYPNETGNLHSKKTRAPNVRGLNAKTSPREPIQTLQKEPLTSYDQLFQEAYQNTSKSLNKEDLQLHSNNDKSTYLEEEKTPQIIPPQQCSTPNPPSTTNQENKAQSHQKQQNKKKGNKKEQQNHNNESLGHQSSVQLKEMRERGAIARPTDIENATRKQGGANNGQGKKDKQKNAGQNAQQVTNAVIGDNSTLISPQVAMGIQRSQTPNAQQSDGLINNAQSVKGNQHQNNKQTKGNNNQVKNNNNNNLNPNKQPGHPNAKRKQNNLQGANQQLKQQQLQQHSPVAQAAAQQQLFQQFIDPTLLHQQQQQQLLDSQTHFNLQQALFQQQQQHQQQQLLQSAQFPHAFFGGAHTQPGANPFLGQGFHNTTQPFTQYPQNPFTVGFDPQPNPNAQYTVSSMQTNTEIANENIEKSMSQQTQTENSEQNSANALPQGNSQQVNPSFVMHQYQNFNLQFHMPNPQPAANHLMQIGANPYIFPAQMGFPNLMDPTSVAAAAQSFNPQQNLLFPQQQQFQQAALISSLLNNPLGLNTFGLTPQPTTYNDLQTQLQHQALLMQQNAYPTFNPLFFNNTPTPASTFQTQSPNLGAANLGAPNTPNFQQLLQQTGSVPQGQFTQNPQQHHRTNRMHSMPVQHNSHHHANHSLNQFAQNPHMLQSILSELVLQNNSLNAIQTQSNISHMSQDQYEEQNFSSQREEQFFFKMDQEIYKLQNKIKIKLSSIESERQSVLRRIEVQIQETYSECPNARVEMYGSMATGLAIDSSDMDLLVSGIFMNLMMQQDKKLQSPYLRPFQQIMVERPLLIEQMRRLYREFTNLESPNPELQTLKECLENVQIIETASVPVIKLVIDLQKIRNIEGKASSPSKQAIEEDMRLLKIDITFNDQLSDSSMDLLLQPGFHNFNQNLHMGIRCCQFIRKKLEEYPTLESLTLVLKKFLALRNLNSPYMGGLNSYGLILLLVAFLNLDWNDFYNKDNQISSARVLKNFLLYFGQYFDSNQSMINEHQQVIQHINFSSIPIIQDPLNPANNIGKSTFNFDTIRQEFNRAHDKIADHLQEFKNSAMTETDPQTVGVSGGGATTQDDQKLGVSAKGAGSSPGIWKKKLDVLHKILQVQADEQIFQGTSPDIAEHQLQASPQHQMMFMNRHRTGSDNSTTPKKQLTQQLSFGAGSNSGMQ